MTPSREPVALLVAGALCLALSGFRPLDRTTWLLEVGPILLGVPVLVALRPRFPLTPLANRLVFFHALVLMLGAHYTYEKVPLGFWIRDAFDLARNHYDRFGHLIQGFVPAILAREVLLRTAPLRPGTLLVLLVTSVCLAISALYELLEWAAAVALGEGADAFLATQGDPWDTQADMLLALFGAGLAQLVLSRLHDRHLEALRARPDPGRDGR